MVVVNPLEQERREQKRLQIDSTVRFYIRGTTNIQNSVVKDLSRGGLRLAIDQFLPKESSLALEMKIKGILNVLNIDGKVAWIKEVGYTNNYQVGVKFHSLNVQTKAILSEFLQLQSALASSERGYN